MLEQISSYRLEEEVARGGMGIMYRSGYNSPYRLGGDGFRCGGGSG
jgi:hypothetical protein